MTLEDLARKITKRWPLGTENHTAGGDEEMLLEIENRQWK